MSEVVQVTPLANGSVKGTLAKPVKYKAKPRSYTPERLCSDCGKTLSIYNKGPLCYVHSRKKYPRVRGVRPELR